MHYTIIKTINFKYFNSKMDRTWKKYIKQLVRKYKFDDNVIYTLLDYCKNKGHLEQNYIARVAESWYKNNIITNKDLENYYQQYENFINLKTEIKEHIKTEMTDLEEAYIEKWVMDYKLSNDEIISGLKNATDKNFAELDKELTKIYDNN